MTLAETRILGQSAIGIRAGERADAGHPRLRILRPHGTGTPTGQAFAAACCSAAQLRMAHLTVARFLGRRFSAIDWDAKCRVLSLLPPFAVPSRARAEKSRLHRRQPWCCRGSGDSARARRDVTVLVFAFRGRSAANKLPIFRGNPQGHGDTGTTRTERTCAVLRAGRIRQVQSPDEYRSGPSPSRLELTLHERQRRSRHGHLR